MTKASESRWEVRTGADGMPNGLPSVRTERFAGGICLTPPRASARLRRGCLPVIRTGAVSTARRRYAVQPFFGWPDDVRQMRELLPYRTKRVCVRQTNQRWHRGLSVLFVQGREAFFVFLAETNEKGGGRYERRLVVGTKQEHLSARAVRKPQLRKRNIQMEGFR